MYHLASYDYFVAFPWGQITGQRLATERKRKAQREKNLGEYM
jgi:hypothetical protein